MGQNFPAHPHKILLRKQKWLIKAFGGSKVYVGQQYWTQSWRKGMLRCGVDTTGSGHVQWQVSVKTISNWGPQGKTPSNF